MTQRLSESQSRALYERERPYRVETWTSNQERKKRRSEPPAGTDAKVAWLRREWEGEIPEAIHESGVDDSELGAPPLSGPMRNRLGSPHSKDDYGDLIKPMQSSLKWLRGHRRHAHDIIFALIYSAKWDWRSMAGVPFYRRRRNENGEVVERILVRVMDLPVLEMVLDSALDALWHEFTQREASEAA